MGHGEESRLPAERGRGLQIPLDPGHDRRGHQLSPLTLHGVRAQHNNWSLSPLLDHLFPSQNLCSPDHGQSPAGLQRSGDREL